jgi:superfamily II DNA or RNA helicase
MELREYQKRSIREIFDAWNPQKENLKRILFQMPTGTGKTTVFSQIVKKAFEKNKKVLLVAHRAELVEQIVNRLSEFEIDAGIISANFPANENLDIQVASIQTLTRRSKPDAEIVIIDECHHAKAATYQTLWEIYPHAWFLGVTATPWRLSGDGFTGQFDKLICLENLSYYFENNYLVKVKHLVSGIPDLSKVPKRMKDYDLKILNNVMMENKLMANLIESYKQHVMGKRMIVFAVDVAHSLEITHRYKQHGIPAAHLDANTPKEVRRNTLEKFKKGEILVISNVEIISEGFDVPACDAVQLARPTKSLALYLQQVGRCMRTAPGKEYGYVLDNAGLWLEHGLSFIDRNWQLGSWKPPKKGKFQNGEIQREVVGIDENGVFQDIKLLEEAEGLELINLTEEIEDCLVFHAYLNSAIMKGNQVSSAIMRFSEYLFEKRKYLSPYHEAYGHKIITMNHLDYKKGFWFFQRERIKKALDNNMDFLEYNYPS